MRRIDLDTINFEFGSFEVAPDQYPKLERLARIIERVLKRNEAEVFLIEGHTDAVGSDDDNLTLADHRAESVAAILVSEFGIPVENLVTQGYGEQFLKVETEAPERQNRRVAFRRITPLLGLQDR
jgi:outer membrane protein OmpA-like peptidoglycan-associated protein